MKRRHLVSGVKTLEEKEGVGLDAAKGDLVEFDSQGFLSRGETVQPRLRGSCRIGLRRVIAGIEYALIGMKVGGYRKVKISPHLAYRDEGVAGTVPPNAVLVYELWMLRIEKTAPDS